VQGSLPSRLFFYLKVKPLPVNGTPAAAAAATLED